MPRGSVNAGPDVGPTAVLYDGQVFGEGSPRYVLRRSRQLPQAVFDGTDNVQVVKAANAQWVRRQVLKRWCISQTNLRHSVCTAGNGRSKVRSGGKTASLTGDWKSL